MSIYEKVTIMSKSELVTFLYGLYNKAWFDCVKHETNICEIYNSVLQDDDFENFYQHILDTTL